MSKSNIIIRHWTLKCFYKGGIVRNLWLVILRWTGDTFYTYRPSSKKQRYRWKQTCTQVWKNVLICVKSKHGCSSGMMSWIHSSSLQAFIISFRPSVPWFYIKGLIFAFISSHFQSYRPHNCNHLQLCGLFYLPFLFRFLFAFIIFASSFLASSFKNGRGMGTPLSLPHFRSISGHFNTKNRTGKYFWPKFLSWKMGHFWVILA